MRTKRIGLLTYFHEDNPGQYWQAYWTVQAFQDRCPDVPIEIPAIYPWRKPKAFSLKDLRRPEVFFKGAYKRQCYRAARAQLPISRVGIASSDRDSVLRWLKLQGYGSFVVGADVAIKHWPERFKGGLQPFLIEPQVGSPYAFLASSSDITDWSLLTNEVQNAYRRSINGASFRAVRDVMTRAVFRSARVGGSWDVDVVPDPTFYAPALQNSPGSFFSRRFKSFKDSVHSTGKRLLGVNLPNGRFKNDLASAGRNGWVVVDIGARPTIGSWWGWGGPCDWEYLISEVDGLITSSFHETIYAEKNGTPVVSIDAEWKRVQRGTALSKLRCLHDCLAPGLLRYANVTGAEDTQDEVRKSLLWLAGCEKHNAVSTAATRFKAEYYESVNRLSSCLFADKK